MFLGKDANIRREFIEVKKLELTSKSLKYGFQNQKLQITHLFSNVTSFSILELEMKS